MKARYLLDTMALLWMGLRPDLLSPRAKNAIESDCTLHYSIVSLWEIGIKMSRSGYQSFTLPHAWDQFFSARLEASGVRCLPIVPLHCRLVQEMPMHHKDPFDRMIIAQALDHKLAVVTSDDAFLKYGIEKIW
ncbi:MAG: type II toxin-antitoxin system VapC family toxin [Verrucomicrobia bacterium]|jgi:PIN domain nuclease of toxin-antitoxin system|nr:MAG: type II toxin-antitoxin system VapC family toxin [Verrucomicrobiota bacterium]